MSRRDTRSIKYVLEELDPAEKIEFERELTRDPDLIIEVESIKRMQNRLRNLPEIHPPAELTDSILQMAASKASQKSAGNFNIYLTAAVFLFGLTAASIFIDNPFETDDSHSNASIQMSGTVLNSDEFSQTVTSNNLPTPWIDRNEVLRLGSFENGSGQSRLIEHYERPSQLRPAENSFYRGNVTRSLQLTGSNQPR